MREKLECYLALNRIAGIGAVMLNRLVLHFEVLDEVFAAPLPALRHLGLSSSQAQAIHQFDWHAIEPDLRWLAEKGQHALLLGESGYPSILMNISSPPIVLFLKGDLACLATPQLAMVGSRHPTPIGRDNAYQFARHLSSSGLTITSGLALGIDAASHTGALEAGKTIAVLGSGLDQIYPRRHQELARHIVERGALLSEFPIGSKPLPGHFPRRNRLISGLSLGVLVVEAAIQSGSLITARYAMEQGRDVFAMPGSIHNALSKGCHRLIRDGAKLVETARDIIEELGAMLELSVELAEQQSKEVAVDLSSEELALLNNIDEAPTATDIILSRMQLSPTHLSPILLQLELKGFIKTGVGGYSRLKNIA